MHQLHSHSKRPSSPKAPKTTASLGKCLSTSPNPLGSSKPSSLLSSPRLKRLHLCLSIHPRDKLPSPVAAFSEEPKHASTHCGEMPRGELLLRINHLFRGEPCADALDQGDLLPEIHLFSSQHLHNCVGLVP